MIYYLTEAKKMGLSMLSGFDVVVITLAKLAWNLSILSIGLLLTLVWLGFLFGSVIGVIVVLVFAPQFFIWPFLIFSALCISLETDK